MDEFESFKGHIRRNKKLLKVLFVGVGGFLLIVVMPILLFSSYTVVDAGHSGVKITLGKVSEDVLSEGLHFKKPFVAKVIQIDNRVMKTEVDSNAASKDLQSILLKVSVNYRVIASASAKIYKNVGKDFANVIVNPAIQECVKSVAAKYNAEQLITNRAAVSAEMEKEISQKINPYGLNVEIFNIINFDFSDEFNKAIEAKQTAQQQALKAEQDLTRIKVEAAQLIEKAKAESSSYELKNEKLTDKVIMMEFVEKWDGKLPVVTSGGSAYFDLSSIMNREGMGNNNSENSGNNNDESGN